MAGGIIGSLMYAVGFKFNSGGLDEADSKVKKLTKGVIGLGSLAGTAMIGIGTAALNAASDFENAMSHVQLTTGQTTDQMEATREIAKNLYNQNFGEDWADLGGSISAVAKATGLTGTALENASREAMLYADKFDGDVTESIAGVSVAMNNFGVTSTEAFNLLTQGQTRGVDTQGDMLDSMNEYSQAFASMGFTMEDTMGYFDNGMKAGARSTDLLGDAMNEFSILSIEAGGTAEESFQSLGLDATKMMKTFSGGGPAAKAAFKDIVSMISDIEDPVQQNTIGVGLFGTMFEELGVKAFSALDDVNTSFDQSKDSAANLFNSFTSIGDSFQYFKRHVETGILIPIGQKLLPYLNMFGSWISGHQPQIEAFGNAIGNGLGVAIEKVSGWVQQAVPYLQQFGSQAQEAFGMLVEKGKELWTAIQPVVVLIGETLVGAAVALWPHIQTIATQIYEVSKAFTEWDGFVPLVSGITAAFVTYKSVIIVSTIKTKALAAASKIAAAATKVWTGIQAAWNAVMTLNPIGIVIAALVGLGVALVVAYKRSDKFRAFIDKMWSGIKTATMATLNFFKVTVPKVFVTAFNAVTGFLKKWGFVLLTIIGGPLGLVVGLVIRHWDKVKTTTVVVFSSVWNWLKNVWNGIKTTVSVAARSVWSAVTTAWGKVSETTRAIFTTIWNKVKSVWTGITGTVAGAVSNVWGEVKGAWNNVFSTTNSLMTQVWNKITGIWNQIVSGVKTAGTNLWTAVSDMWGNVTGFFDGINLFTVGENIIQGLIDGISSMAETLKTTMADIGNGIADKVREVLGIHSPSRVMMEVGLYTGEGLINGLEDITSKVGLASGTMANEVTNNNPNSDISEYSRYTPETEPARTTNNTSKAEFNPVINITLPGNTDVKTIASLRAAIREELQDIFDSASRIMGVEFSGAD